MDLSSIDNMLGFWSDQAHSALEGLRMYLSTIETFIESEKRSEIDSLSMRAEQLPDSAKEEFWAWHYPVHWDDIFATQLRSSFLVTLMSLVESHVSTVAKESHGKAQVAIGPRDLHGCHLERHRKYFDKVLSFQTPTAEQWNSICGLSDIRNQIVHAQSLAWSPNDKTRSRLERLARQLPGVSVDYSVFQFDTAFPQHALDQVASFIQCLYLEAGRLLQRSVYWRTGRV